jgi:tetratricopeptide (TPR) repeat protein
MFSTNEININNEKVYGSYIVNKVNLILPQSCEYKDLLDQLNREEKYFKKLTADEQQERLETSEKINNLKKLIEQFKNNVLQLAEQFNRIEINTDRLRRAKEFFDKGEFGEARAVLKTELEQMQNEQTRLLEEKKRYETEVLPKLVNNSEEFLILAISTSTDYTNPGRYQDTCNYFERSIQSCANKSNVFQYALFLYQHNEFTIAEKYYSQCLVDFASRLSHKEKAEVLNNLAHLHSYQNRYEEALTEYKEALQIYRILTETNPEDYLPYVGLTLTNLTNLYSTQNNYEAALKVYEEASQIYQHYSQD